MVEFGMNVQEACEAPNIISYQMKNSLDDHEKLPGKLTLNDDVPPWVRTELGLKWATKSISASIHRDR